MKTVRMLGLVQEGAMTVDKLRHLEQAIGDLYAMHFGNQYRVVAYWLYTPVGHAFVAGEQSRSSAVMLPVADDLPLHARHDFMFALCALWMRITGCSASELVLNVSSHSYAANYVKANSNRYRPMTRLISQLRLISRFVLAQLRSQCKLISVNMH